MRRLKSLLPIAIVFFVFSLTLLPTHQSGIVYNFGESPLRSSKSNPFPNFSENEPKDQHFGDADGDKIKDEDDNCPVIPNPDQLDTDGDLRGDLCDDDDDNDTILDHEDNCPFTINPDQEDLDHDGIGDVCDDDVDGDGMYPVDLSPYPSDLDGDGFGDVNDDCITSDTFLRDGKNTDEDSESKKGK